jgi:hypothetical protein
MKERHREEVRFLSFSLREEGITNDFGILLLASTLFFVNCIQVLLVSLEVRAYGKVPLYHFIMAMQAQINTLGKSSMCTAILLTDQLQEM